MSSSNFSTYSSAISLALTISAPGLLGLSWWLSRRTKNRSRSRADGTASSNVLTAEARVDIAASAESWDDNDQTLFLHAMSANPDDEIVPPLTGGQRAAIARLFREELAKVERERKAPEPEWKTQNRGAMSILLAFAIVVIAFGTMNMVHYWHAIRSSGDLMLWGFGLFVTMIGGMFVQVLSANYRSGKPLFAVYGSELAFPVLFSLVVFYPVWALTANGSQTLFSYYAAFLNGYFWQAIVSAARVPTGA